MKKHLFPFVLVLCILCGACNTTKKLYEAKEYDQVIMNAAPKLCAGRISNNLLDMVARSYHQANQADHERILALKATGEPDIWPEIYERYCSMKGRNEALSCLPEKVKKHINYTSLQLDEPLSAARNKAEAYLTAKISQTLDEENPDLDKTDEMIWHLESINPKNTQLNEFKIKSLGKQYGDLSRLVHFEVQEYKVSPEKDETVSFKEMKDNHSATITDHTLSKDAKVKGKMVFIDPKSKRMLLSLPFEANSVFKHNYTTMEGDMEACSEQTLERLKQKPVPFPTKESLIEDAITKLKQQMINQ